MKARVKATGEIVDVAYTYKTVGKNPTTKCETLEGKRYNEEDLNFNIEDDNTTDYWDRLEHLYAGMAMQGIVSNEDYLKSFYEDGRGSLFEDIARACASIAHALVEKLKEKEERK